MEDLSKPGEAKSYDLEKKLHAIAWRPVTAELVAYTNGAIYSVDPENGKLSDQNATFMENTKIGEDARIAFDFNNKIDAVRAVSSSGDNLVYFPQNFGNNDEKANSVRRFTDLAYAQGDSNAGKTPNIFANAYTNAIDGKTAGSTFQYALDSTANALVSLANNKGTLETVGLVKINGEPADITDVGGFDIASEAEGDDEAYAILQVDGQETAGLYAMDLKTGDASLIADLGSADFSSFAFSNTQ